MKKYVKIPSKADVNKIKAIIRKNKKLAAKRTRQAKKKGRKISPLAGKKFYYDFK